MSVRQILITIDMDDLWTDDDQEWLYEQVYNTVKQEVPKDYWGNLLEDFSRVYLAEDGDNAGKDLWIAMSEHIDQSNTMVIRMRMPDGEDSNSMFVKHGKDYLLGRIKK